ncbi:MAG: DEAD/DEAH box helicase family protein [Phycisphaeraceae bacterium]|nr:DEAD/DEAH box helicase family protein [Phycisphaeraceae bacterium]
MNLFTPASDECRPMSLRPYQREAVEAVYRHLRERDDNPCVVCPTGAGKSLIIAQICRDAIELWNGRVLILAHVRELLEQAVDKLHAMAPDLWSRIGVYSAGLRSRDTDHPIIVAGIQSVYRRAAELDRFDLILVDECFVAGTLVSTPSGAVPIEQVQPGLSVHNAAGVGQVIAVSARAAHEVVTLEYNDGTAITCTPNHPLLTPSGWRPAGSLEVDSLAIGVESLRVLRDKVSPVAPPPPGWRPDGPERESVDEAALLLEVLLEAPREPHAFVGDSQKSQPGPQDPRAWPEYSRRQWSADSPTGKTPATARRRVVGRMGRSSARIQDASPAQEFEDRSGKPTAKDRGRIGWTEPSLTEAARRRCPQDDLPGTKRLVRVSHHQPPGGRVVFNLQVSGHPSYFANGILAHNCHLIPPDGEGMYRTFLREVKGVNPNARLIGLTATPFRMSSGPICVPAPEGIINAICYEVGVRELIRDGYLSPLKSKGGRVKPDFRGLHVRAGEFVSDEVEQLMDQDALVHSACREIVDAVRTGGRRACLVFASGVEHGKHVARTIEQISKRECGFIDGQTPMLNRDEMIRRFRAGDLAYLVNVNVLTTGFDAPNVDCVALLRPTMSPGLYCQQVGRGFRLAPGKTDCLVLDFGGNVMRHGPVDAIRIEDPHRKGSGSPPVKECPECHALIATGFQACPECGFAFPAPKTLLHQATASNTGVLSGEVTVTEFAVQDVYFSVHQKRGATAEAPRSMRVEYRVGFNYYRSEWVCFEHAPGNYARMKAEAWWRQRSNLPVPASAEEAVELAQSGALADTLAITVRHVAGEKYERIVDYRLGPKPAGGDGNGTCEWDRASVEPDYVPVADDEVPF